MIRKLTFNKLKESTYCCYVFFSTEKKFRHFTFSLPTSPIEKDSFRHEKFSYTFAMRQKNIMTQQTITCSKSTKVTLERGLKYVQS